MIDRRNFLTGATTLAALTAGISGRALAQSTADPDSFPVQLSEAEWRERLTSDQFLVLRQGATERPNTSPLHEEMRPGVYACAGCGQDVYSSEEKFHSDSGWPAFSKPIEGAIEGGPDERYGEMLTEVHCSNCGSHHGHIFNDGPPPTGERHCINGLGLDFKPA